jgi:hypothetical protein
VLNAVGICTALVSQSVTLVRRKVPIEALDVLLLLLTAAGAARRRRLLGLASEELFSGLSPPA